MTTERKPLWLFVKQKAEGNRPSGSTSPTSADVKKKLMEVLDTFQDATAVSAIGRAIAQPNEHQGSQMPAPWEGITETAKAFGIDLGQLWQTREHELSLARQAADERDKELHELRLREIDRRVEELQKMANNISNTSQGQGDSHRSRMDEAIDNLIASRIGSILGGNNEQQLTPDDVQKIALKAVQDGTQQQQTPQQIVESLMGFILAAETAKKKMTELGGGGVNGNPYLTQAGNMRSDVLKILLENDRETLKMNYEHEIQKERNKHLGIVAGAVKDNMEDIIGASRDMVNEHRESRGKPQKQKEHQSEEGFGIKCSECGEVSVYQEVPSGTFECQHCGAKLRLQQQPGQLQQGQLPRMDV